MKIVTAIGSNPAKNRSIAMNTVLPGNDNLAIFTPQSLGHVMLLSDLRSS
jgi:hypothetical protein